MRSNTIAHDLPWPRRAVIRGMGLAALAAGLAAMAIGQSPARRPTRAGPLEATPSTVDYVVYAGADGLFARDEPTADADVADAFADFGFPTLPLACGTDTAGAVFDTTAPTVSADGGTIDYFLRFGGRQTPYQLTHQGGGTYRSGETVVDFEWTDAELYPLPFFTVGETYRAVVRDVVQLYGPGGAFDWSATRTDFFARPSGTHVASVLTAVWDEDGPANSGLRHRGTPGRPVDHADGPSEPVFPRGVTPTVRGLTIEGVVAALVQSGTANAGLG